MYSSARQFRYELSKLNIPTTEFSRPWGSHGYFTTPAGILISWGDPEMLEYLDPLMILMVQSIRVWNRSIFYTVIQKDFKRLREMLSPKEFHSSFAKCYFHLISSILTFCGVEDPSIELDEHTLIADVHLAK
jgi:hypothetical protein